MSGVTHTVPGLGTPSAEQSTAQQRAAPGAGDMGDNVGASSWEWQDGRAHAGEEWGKREVVVTEQTPQSRAECGGESFPPWSSVWRSSSARSVMQGQVHLVPTHSHCKLAKLICS